MSNENTKISKLSSFINKTKKEKLAFNNLRFESLSDANDLSIDWLRFKDHVRLSVEVSLGKTRFELQFGCSKKSLEGKRGTPKTRIWKRLMAARSSILDLAVLHRIAQRISSQKTPQIYETVLSLRDKIVEELSKGSSGELIDQSLGTKPLLVDSMLVDSPVWLWRLKSHYKNCYFCFNFWQHPYGWKEPDFQSLYCDTDWRKVPFYMEYIRVWERKKEDNYETVSLHLAQGELLICLFLNIPPEIKKTIESQSLKNRWELVVIRHLFQNQDHIRGIWEHAHCLEREVQRLMKENSFELLSDYRFHKMPTNTLKNIDTVTGEIIRNGVLPDEFVEPIFQNNEEHSWNSDSLEPAFNEEGIDKIRFDFDREVGGLSFQLSLMIPTIPPRRLP